MTEATTEQSRPGRGQRRALVGVVVADAMQKTVRVRLDILLKHAKYGKYLKHHKVIHVHDEENVCRAGDVVEILECRPISKTKSWRVARKVKQAVGAK